MFDVTATGLPEAALLGEYATADNYTDAYTASLDRSVTLPEFICAFYATPLFRCERFVLGVAGYGSSDDDLAAMAHGSSDSFAAWRVEARGAQDILLTDQQWHTRSWLMARDEDARTTLWFGSAVIGIAADAAPSRRTRAFRALLGFHKVYSQALLAGAHRALTAG